MANGIEGLELRSLVKESGELELSLARVLLITLFGLALVANASVDLRNL